MNLNHLEPQFIRYTGPGRHQDVGALYEAHGIIFLCPSCFAKNGGPIGTHSIMVWFKNKGVPDVETPGPGRWAVVSGTGVANLSLAPSIQLSTGCLWHGNVTNGQIVHVNDPALEDHRSLSPQVKLKREKEKMLRAHYEKKAKEQQKDPKDPKDPKQDKDSDVGSDHGKGKGSGKGNS